MNNTSDEARLLIALYTATANKPDRAVAPFKEGAKLHFSRGKIEQFVEMFVRHQYIAQQSDEQVLLTPLGFVEGDRLRVEYEQELKIQVIVEIYKRARGSLHRVVDITDFAEKHFLTTAFLNRLVESHLIIQMQSFTTRSVMLRGEGRELAEKELENLGKAPFRSWVVKASENPLISNVVGGIIGGAVSGVISGIAVILLAAFLKHECGWTWLP